jgi:hypothetical protein
MSLATIGSLYWVAKASCLVSDGGHSIVSMGDCCRHQSTATDTSRHQSSGLLPHGLPQMFVLEADNKNPQMLAHLGISD